MIDTEKQAASEEARLKWARSKAKAFGIPEDSPQIDVIATAVWPAAFEAGIEFANKRWDRAMANGIRAMREVTKHDLPLGVKDV